MNIIHPIDKFFFELFPAARGKSEAEIIEEVRKYYTWVGFQSSISLREGLVVVELDAGPNQTEERDFNRAVSLCETGKFSEAKPILLKLIEKNPANSEYHRILGQVYSEEGDQDEAINSLIDALRWNPKNGWALLLTGNIFGKFRNDVATAMQYEELFGIRITNDFNAPKPELNRAAAFYDEYKEYREDREPGEEYELLYNWADDLNLTDFFGLRPDDFNQSPEGNPL